MEKTQEQIYERSKIVLLFKKILVILKSLLPKKWYNLFYKFAFRVYKSFLRLYYFRFIIYYKIKRDNENLKKTKIIYMVMPYSLVGTPGLSQTYDIAIEIEKNNIDGCLVECGIAQGGSSALMALIARDYKNREIWLFDSFEGLPEPTAEDFLHKTKLAGNFIRPLEKSSCLGTYEEVEKLFFSKLRINKKNVRMIKGWFQNTLPKYKSKINKISLLRIDADWYESTKCCLENLYDNVVDGGFVIIDDYGTCFGAKKALDEFLEKKKLSVKLVHDGRGGCYFKKIN